MIKRLSPIFLMTSLSLAACGGGDSLDKPSDAVKASIEAQCQKAHDCMASYDQAMHNDTPFASQYGASAAACVTQTTALIEQFLGADYFAKLDASASAGRISYNGTDAQTCIDASTALTCDQFFGQNGATSTSPAACDTAIKGTVATSGTCTLDNDCATNGDSCDASMTCSPG